MRLHLISWLLFVLSALPHLWAGEEPGLSIATRDYLSPVVAELRKTWPENRAVTIVCHGHSVPAGYARTPVVRILDAYPPSDN